MKVGTKVQMGLKGFVFKHGEYKKFDRLENSVLKMLFSKVAGGKDHDDGLLKSEKNDDSGIMTLNFIAKSEDLAIKFSNHMYEELSKFYIYKTTEKQKQRYDLTSLKTDSLKTLLDVSEYKLLKFQDRNRSITLRQYEAEQLKLQRQVQTLMIAHAEALKNKEIADFALKSKTPFIQTLDEPISPLFPNTKNYLSKIIVGLFLGGFVGTIFIVIRKIFREIMNE